MLEKMNNIDYEKITIYDIRHQDIYYVYKDKKGYYYDLSGNLINIEKYINYNTSYEQTNNNVYKIKSD
jgi:hypothetical protein